MSLDFGYLRRGWCQSRGGRGSTVCGSVWGPFKTKVSRPHAYIGVYGFFVTYTKTRVDVPRLRPIWAPGGRGEVGERKDSGQFGRPAVGAR